MKMSRFPFFKIPSSSVFVLTLEVTHRNQWESKIPFIVLLPIGQLLVLENHNICMDRLQYYSKNYERAYLDS